MAITNTKIQLPTDFIPVALIQDRCDQSLPSCNVVHHYSMSLKSSGRLKDFCNAEAFQKGARIHTDGADGGTHSHTHTHTHTHTVPLSK